ncbi:MAG: putative bifunctional diguanylate cyclase/phosphodiesterase [Chloroflexota bacterium]
MQRLKALGPALAEARGAYLVLALGAYVVLSLLWQIYRWGGDEYKTLIGNALILPLNAWAALRAYRTAHSTALPAASRKAWHIVTCAFVAYFSGHSLYFVLESLLHVEPFPSVADVGFLSFYPLMLWGLLSFPLVMKTREERSRFWLDAAIVSVGGGMVLWHFILRPTATAEGADPLTTALGIGYVVGDLVLMLGIATILLRRTDSATQLVMHLMALGLLCICVADMAFAYLTLTHAYQGGDWPDAFWIIGIYLLGVSAQYQHWRAEHAPLANVEEGDQTSPFAWLPYLMIVLGYGLLVWVARTELGNPIWELILGAVMLTALVMARQVASARENSQLLAEITQQRSEARFRSLVQNLSDMIAVCDTSGTLAYGSPSLLRAIGWESQPCADISLLSAVHPLDEHLVHAYLRDVSQQAGVSSPIEFRLISGGEQWINVETIASNLIDDENVGGIVLNIRDISERKVLENQLTHQAFHDTLTGLANRALFHDRVEHALARNARSLHAPAVLFLDVDDFKTVNDSLGHAEGDRMLLTISDRLRSCLRAGDTAARIGGDEFAVLLEDVRSLDDATQIAARISEVVRDPIHVQGREVTVQTSIGIAIRSSFSEVADDLMRNADVALYSVKSRGKNHVGVFAPEMHDLLVNRLSVRSDLQGAVERGEFRLHYQPIVSLDTEELVGVEALVRWQHPVRGMIPPAEFISLAEETGQIVDIGRWVLLEACRQTKEWHDQLPSDGRAPLFVSVNLSSRQLEHADLVDHVAEALLRSRLDPAYLTLEITESLLMQHTEVNIRKIRELSDLGLPMAVDDFGTGYSSLSYLRRFPVKVLKVDKSFVDGIEDDPEAETLVRAIISLGHALNLHIVAEGVEQPGQLERLRAMGCDKGQGYLFGKPLPAEELTHRLSSLLPNLARRFGVELAA